MGEMRSCRFSNDWKFKLSSEDASAYVYDDSQWQELDLPHDWKIGNVDTFYSTETGWYRKTFYLPEENRGKNTAIRFDSVQNHSTLFVNGTEVGKNCFGYTSFQFDITGFLNYGNTPNVIAVRVDFQYEDAWWYTGAGMHRDVWLTITDPVHVNHGGIYITTNGMDEGTIETEVVNTSGESKTVIVRQTVLDADGKAVAVSEGSSLTVAAGALEMDTQTFTVADAKLWSLEHPNLYIMRTEILDGEKVLDTYRTRFGFRTIAADPNEGFFLNGEYRKLHGVCLHSELGALGGAENYAAIKTRLLKMKAMGANAIRTAHNLCDEEWLDLCDELGILVCDEGLVGITMIHHTDSVQTEHRACSPNLSESPTVGELEVRNWIRRDRNHPCVIIWSTSNEAGLLQTEEGIERERIVMAWVREEEPKKNALVANASNIMYTETMQKLALDLEINGYNYGENLYESHRAKYGDKLTIFGSETASQVSSRGIYHVPADKPVYQHMDRQVSSYGNSVVPWGLSAEKAWIYDRDAKYCLGQFVWTGYDYIREPTPYSDAESKNSYFGIVDTAGLPKDVYYFYQSVWTEKPMVHLLPYWDSNMGETITVFAYSNADSVELFLNGNSLGKKSIDPDTASVLHYSWDVPYEDGEVTARAYDAEGNVTATDRVATFYSPAKVKVEADRTEIRADGRDLFYVTAGIYDENNEFVATARNNVTFQVSGAGELVGVDNGDSTDFDQYLATQRRAFSGKVVAIVRSDGTEGCITVTAESRGLVSDSVTVQAAHEQPVTAMELFTIDGTESITTHQGSLKLTAKVNDGADYEKVSYTVTDESGKDTNCAVIDHTGVLTALRDGTVVVHAEALDGSKVAAQKRITISGQRKFRGVEGITITASTEAITEKSGICNLTAAVTPEDAERKAVRWFIVSGAECARLEQSGTLTALYDGTVTVRARAMDGSGICAEKTIAISGQSSAEIPANKIQLEVIEDSAEATDTKPCVRMKATLLPEGAAGEVEWAITEEDGTTTSSAARIDAVDEDGVVTIVPQQDSPFYVTAFTRNGRAFSQVSVRKRFSAFAGVEDVSSHLEVRSAYQTIEAESYDEAMNTSGKLESTSQQDGTEMVTAIRCGLNDTLKYKNIDFGTVGSAKVCIRGKIDADSGSKQIMLTLDQGSEQIVRSSVDYEDGFAAYVFDADGITGVHNVEISFIQGQDFLFDSFVFTEK